MEDKPLKWLIYGHQGWIGSQVVKLLKAEATNELYLSPNRVDNLSSVVQDLDFFQPDRVISLIGRTSGPITTEQAIAGTIDYLEQKGKLQENLRDNLFGPVALAELCSQRKIHFTYLGTGCIFSSNNEVDLFDEEAEPNFFGSSYSVVKGFTDRLMHLYNDRCLNVRIRMPITRIDHPRNFISKIIRYSKVISVPNSMTVLDQLLPIMLRCAKEKETGTLNLCNPGAISHNEILDLYREHIDPSFIYQNFTQDELLKVTACGRSNNELSTERLQSLSEKYGLKLSPIKEAVEETMKNWQSNPTDKD